MGKRNGFKRTTAGELILWCNGTEVMAFDTNKASFFAADPVAQKAHIAASGNTSTGDEKASVNSSLVTYELLGLTAS
jgi:hypothetical protein